MNSTPSNRHLSEDELDEVLMGIGSPAAAAHLAFCDPCGERLSEFQVQVAIFNQASLDWSTARSNTISRDLAHHKPTPRLTLTTMWSSIATFALALAFGVTAAVQHASVPAGNPPAQVAAVADPQSDLAADDAMLANIDSEVNTPATARLNLYVNTNAPVRHTSGSHSKVDQTQD